MSFTSLQKSSGLGRSLDAMDARDGGAFTGVFQETPTRHVETHRSVFDLQKRTPIVQQATAPVVVPVAPSAPPVAVVTGSEPAAEASRFPAAVVALVALALVLSQE